MQNIDQNGSQTNKINNSFDNQHQLTAAEQTININTNKTPATQNKTKPKKTLLIIGFCILLTIVGIGAYLFYVQSDLSSNLYQEEQIDETNTTTNESENINQNLCEIKWINPIFLPKGEVEPLFLRETDAISGAGYEAIVRRTVDEDEQGSYVAIDLVTNSLPDENSPYYLFALAVDDQGTVCSQSNLGPLIKEDSLGVWTAGPLTIPVEMVNDAQLFVITKQGFGSRKTDQIENLDNSAIILLGSYSQNHSQNNTQFSEEASLIDLTINYPYFFNYEESTNDQGKVYRIDINGELVADCDNPNQEECESWNFDLSIEYLKNSYPNISTVKQYLETDYQNFLDQQKPGELPVVPGYVETFKQNADFMFDPTIVSSAELNYFPEYGYVFLLMDGNNLYKLKLKSPYNSDNEQELDLTQNDPIIEIIKTIKIKGQPIYKMD